MECVLAGSISGVVFALVSGQPLNVLSATGPMLILEGIIHRLCEYVFLLIFFFLMKYCNYILISVGIALIIWNFVCGLVYGRC